ncbi:MAG: integrin alpha [Planctomycetota bacterium]
MTAVRLCILSALVASPLTADELGPVETQTKVSATAGITGIGSADNFGAAVASINDVDGDGVVDVAVGVPGGDDGGTSRGEVRIVFLNPDGSVKGQQAISSTEGGFTGVLDDLDFFGSSVAGLGDHDLDGTPDLIVGAPGDDDGGNKRGALWVLFLNPDGTVKAHQKISELEGGFVGGAQPVEALGLALGFAGDVDGDGIGDVAAGTPAAGLASGAKQAGLFLLFLNLDGTVKAEQEIGDGVGGFTGDIEDSDEFGRSITTLGDLDGDGPPDLAVGAPGDKDGGGKRGAVWILFLNGDGTVKSQQKISSTEGGFTGQLKNGGDFGASIANVRDLDDDDLGDLAVGAPGDGPGSIWLIFLMADGTVEDWAKIESNDATFRGALEGADEFGAGVASLGDHDGNTVTDLFVGAPGDDDGELDAGAGYSLFLRGPSETPQLGSGVNPNVFVPGSQPPVIGKVWNPVVVEVAGDGKSILHVLGMSREPAPLIPVDNDELLISTAPGDLIFRQAVAVDKNFFFPIPDDPQLVGLELFTQGGIIKSSGELILTNGLDIVIGF